MTDKDNPHDDNEDSGLGPSTDPHMNPANMLGEAYKDHSNILNALQWEFGQNAIDAVLWAIAEQGRDNTECVVYFRVNTDENRVEMWDNAIGMGEQKLAQNFLSIGESGDEKNRKDTGGSQGKGFWSICGWGEEAYVETHEQNGTRWCARAYPNQFEDNISDIVHPSDVKPEDRPDRVGREPLPELDEPGTYIQVEEIAEPDMADLTDPERAMRNLEKKFSFALSNPDVDIRIKYEIDGDVYEPSEYDFEEIVEQAAVVTQEDLNTFTGKGETRQLKNLTLVKTEDIPEEFEPPWNGVAMLNGGEYTSSVPFMTVWPYTPKHAEHVHNDELWGWVDASELCDDYEEHGHTGFVRQSWLYKKTGLKDRILEVEDKVFDDISVEENTRSSEKTRQNLIQYLGQFDPDTGTSINPGPDLTEPKIHASTKGHYFDVGDDVPLYTLVSTPSTSEPTTFHISGELQYVMDGDSNEIPEEDRDDPIPFKDSGEIPAGAERYKTSSDPPEYNPPRAGGYEITLEMKKAPDVKSDGNEFTYNIALDRKPVKDITTHTFYVGDVEPRSGESGDNDDDGGRGDDNHHDINTVGFVEKEDKDYRVKLKESNGAWDVHLNVCHPEYKQLKQVLDGFDDADLRTELGTKWGFLRLFFTQTAEKINEMLDEKGVSNSEVRVNVRDMVQERLNTYDEFCQEFSQDSPVNNK